MISNLLYVQPQALLITQRSKDPLVLVNAAIFEDLLQLRFELDSASELGPEQDPDNQPSEI